MSKKLEEFKKQAREENKIEIRDLEIIRLERDEIHDLTILAYGEFESKFGASAWVEIEHDGDEKKTFFGGYELNIFTNFMKNRSLPVDVKVLRSLELSEKSGNTYGALYISEA